MKVLFVEARRKPRLNIKGNLFEDIPKNLPKKLHMIYSVQYKESAEKIKKHLEKQGFIIPAFQQILGCSEIKPKAALFLVGSGKFHALQLALSTGKNVFIYPGFESIEKEIEKEKNREKAKSSVFFASEKIGLLFSAKSGQSRIKEAGKFKKFLERKYKTKKFYSFISETLNKEDLDNFSIPMYVNFACPGLETDSRKIINYKKIKK